MSQHIDDEVDSFFEEMLQEEQKKVQKVGEIIQEKETSFMGSARVSPGTIHGTMGKNSPTSASSDFIIPSNSTAMRASESSLLGENNQHSNLDASQQHGTSGAGNNNNLEETALLMDLQVNPQQFLSSIQRDLNRLSAQERSHKLSALKKLKPLLMTFNKTTASEEQKTHYYSTMQYLFRFVYSAFIRLLEDDVELMRESGCEILMRFYDIMLQEEQQETASTGQPKENGSTLNDIQYSTSHMDQIQESLTLLIPVLASRLQNDHTAHTNQPRETSEEVRHLMMKLFVFVISHFEVTDYLKPICKIVRERLEDNFHNIKRLACESVVVLCTTRDGLYKRFLDNNPIITKLINSLSSNLTHQRHYVRAQAVLALNELIMIRPGGEALKDLAKVIRKLASDTSKDVRENLLTTCENWFINHHDTYSYQNIFITPILIMHSDELDEIQQKALQTMDRLGQKHEEWNEEKLKDQLEYVYEDLSDVVSAPLPAPFNSGSRPRLGSRLIVKHNFKKLFELIQEGLSEWSIQQKEIYAQLLKVVIVYTEKDITQYMDKMLQNWFKVIQDEESEIRGHLHEGVRLAGRYADPDAYLPHIFSFTRAQYATSPITLANVLTVFSIILEQITPKNLEMLSRSYQKIGSEFQGSHLLYHEDKRVVKAVIRAVRQILVGAREESISEDDGFEYFLLLHKMWAQPSNQTLTQDVVPELLRELASKLAVGDAKDASPAILYKLYLRRSIELLSETRDTWDKHSPELFTFERIIKSGIASAPEHSDFVFSLLKTLTQKGQDAAVVSTMFSIIEHMFKTVGDRIKSNINVIVHEIIGVNLPWHAGKSKLKTRMLGISCLNVILSEDLCTEDQLKKLVQDHHKSIVSTLDEFADEMRILSTRVHPLYLKKVHKFLSAKQWEDSFTVLVELLDDKIDQVRIQAVEALSVLCQHVGYDVSAICSEEAFQKFADTLFIHLDDNNREVQNAVFDALNTIQQTDATRSNIISIVAQSMQGRHFVSPHTKLLLQQLIRK